MERDKGRWERMPDRGRRALERERERWSWTRREKYSGTVKTTLVFQKIGY